MVDGTTEPAAAAEATSNGGRGPKAKSSKPRKQIVFLRGASHGAAAGQRRSVTPELAQSLVDRGLARYLKNRQK